MGTGILVTAARQGLHRRELSSCVPGNRFYIFGIVGRNLEVVLKKAFEKGTDLGDVDNEVRLNECNTVQKGGDALEAFDRLVSGLDEPAGCGTTILQHVELLETVKPDV